MCYLSLEKVFFIAVRQFHIALIVLNFTLLLNEIIKKSNTLKTD